MDAVVDTRREPNWLQDRLDTRRFPPKRLFMNRFQGSANATDSAAPSPPLARPDVEEESERVERARVPLADARRLLEAIKVLLEGGECARSAHFVRRLAPLEIGGGREITRDYTLSPTTRFLRAWGSARLLANLPGTRHVLHASSSTDESGRTKLAPRRLFYCALFCPPARLPANFAVKWPHFSRCSSFFGP